MQPACQKKEYAKNAYCFRDRPPLRQTHCLYVARLPTDPFGITAPFGTATTRRSRFPSEHPAEWCHSADTQLSGTPARVRVHEQGAVRKKVPSANEKDPTATAIIPYGKTKSPLGRN